MHISLKLRVCAAILLAAMLLCACNTGIENPSENSSVSEVSFDHGEVSQIEPNSDEEESSGYEIQKEYSPALKITEVMAVNTVTAADSQGRYLPWIEIENVSANSANLAEYVLVTPDGEFSLPAFSLAPGGYYLLFCEQLAQSGALKLTHGGYLTDETDYICLKPDRSFLCANGSETDTPTPGYGAVKSADELIFSEIAPINNVYPVNGKPVPFVELYNSGESDIELGSYFISADEEDRFAAKLPDITLKSGEYAVIDCAQIDFDLPLYGGTLMLTRNDGVLAASVSLPAAKKNRSYGDDKEWNSPTPGLPNTEESRLSYAFDRKGLVINEIVASNTKYYAKDGEYYDLVELKNTGNETVELSDYYLSDSQKNLKLYNLPAQKLAPGEFYVVVCTGIDGKYCPLGISSDGERLILSRNDGTVSDVLDFPRIPTDRSWGRSASGFVYFATPTAGKENGTGFATLSSAPEASMESGFYEGPFDVTLGGEGNIYYTLDCSRPTEKSKLYKGETISITKNTTLRAFCKDGEKIASDIITFNYFINEIDLTLPVIKMSVVDKDFYGSDGIYTNYKGKTEIEGHVAFYVDGKEEFSVNCGVKIAGQYSRKYPKKSYQLKFRAKYGNGKLKYDVFEDGEITEFNALVLRSGSEDYEFTMMRDEYVGSMIADYARETLVQKYRPCNLYINGEYIGVYYIREKINQDFVASYWGVDPDTVSILQSHSYIEDGPNGGWSALNKYIQNHDLKTDEEFEYICENFCIESLIDYQIFYTWADNRDEGNTRLCRSPDYDGGRWHYIFYDSDMAFGMYLQNKNKSTADFLFGKETPKSGHHNSLIYKLLHNNKTFQDMFLKRLEELCNTAFSNEEAVGHIEHIRDLIDHDMQYTKYGVSYKSWKVYVPKLINYVTDRADVLRKEFTDLLKLSKSEREKYFPTYTP